MTPAARDPPDFEARFQQFLQAFLVSQETQALAHQQQTEDFAQFQAQVLDIVERVARLEQAVPIREVDPNAIFEKFLKRGPPEFTGTEDPLVADDWIVRMEKIFRVFECSGRQRVQLAAYMFRSVAEDWWRTVQRPYELIGDDAAWTAFRTDFLRKFIPVHVRDQKMREFQDLVQGDMTIYQYELRFSQLSRFAEDLIASEHQRVRRFIRGLRADVQLHMACVDDVTYEYAVRKAYWAEEHLQQVEVMQQQKRVRTAPLRQQPPVYRQQQQQYRRHGPAGQATQFQQRQQHRPHGACYDCGDPGHIARLCPLRREQPPMLQLSAPPRAPAPVAAQPIRQVAPAAQPPQQQYRTQQ